MHSFFLYKIDMLFSSWNSFFVNSQSHLFPKVSKISKGGKATIQSVYFIKIMIQAFKIESKCSFCRHKTTQTVPC